MAQRRDARGRFASGGGSSGGGGGGKKAAGGGKKAASSGEANASPRIGRKYDAPAAKPKADPKAKGGGGAKAAATKAANKANTDRLVAKGQTGIGSRLKKSTEKSYSGTKATKQKNAQLWGNAEHNRREDGTGANFSKAKAKGTIGRRRK
jgi:hypothetical protein